MPNSSRPSRIPSTNATPNSRNGSATTSIPTPTTPKGSPRKLPPSPKLGLGSPPANARDAANPRPSPHVYAPSAQSSAEKAGIQKSSFGIPLIPERGRTAVAVNHPAIHDENGFL